MTFTIQVSALTTELRWQERFAKILRIFNVHVPGLNKRWEIEGIFIHVSAWT